MPVPHRREAVQLVNARHAGWVSCSPSAILRRNRHYNTGTNRRQSIRQGKGGKAVHCMDLQQGQEGAQAGAVGNGEAGLGVAAGQHRGSVVQILAIGGGLLAAGAGGVCGGRGGWVGERVSCRVRGCLGRQAGTPLQAGQPARPPAPMHAACSPAAVQRRSPRMNSVSMRSQQAANSAVVCASLPQLTRSVGPPRGGRSATDSRRRWPRGRAEMVGLQAGRACGGWSEWGRQGRGPARACTVDSGMAPLGGMHMQTGQRTRGWRPPSGQQEPQRDALGDD